jgi:molecular chaperone GrpE (heat shock protein)
MALDATLSDQLPFLQAEVEGRMQDSGEALNRMEAEIEEQTQRMCREVQEQQAKQEESFFELMKMVSSVIGELKEEISL